MAIFDKILNLTYLLSKTLIAATEINNMIYITTNKKLIRLIHQATSSGHKNLCSIDISTSCADNGTMENHVI